MHILSKAQATRSNSESKTLRTLGYIRHLRFKFLKCQSMFYVTFEGEEYVIKLMKILHNHLRSSSWMIYDPSTRRLFSKDQDNLKPVILQSLSTEEVIASIRE